MHSKPSVKCPASVIGTKGQIIKLKRGGKGGTSGSGPSGWKVRPAAVLQRSLADMAAAYRSRRMPQHVALQKKANGQAEIKLQ